MKTANAKSYQAIYRFCAFLDEHNRCTFVPEDFSFHLGYINICRKTCNIMKFCFFLAKKPKIILATFRNIFLVSILHKGNINKGLVLFNLV
ncbi:hypothetical protein GDO78_007496 [Eleutherodactylus coqui]|uniref:Uncharacterized protein n=1 Tax=Eleutherodactylus coqui TaxID=57060 RepID=A0A8J6KD01_ELECQ|nr:hypothetical protein GDO78_007496 [Eleutherodactylus coqui]